jgi:cell surface protein SprA
MMVKNVGITYQNNLGQALPNFKPNSQLLGMDMNNQNAPGFLFTTGLYDGNIRQTSASNNWLAKIPLQTTPYIEPINKTYLIEVVLNLMEV